MQTNSAQFKSRNRRDRFIRACQPVSITSGHSDPFPEMFHGTVFDPRIDYPPVVKNEARMRLLMRSITNSIKELFSARGIM